MNNFKRTFVVATGVALASIFGITGCAASDVADVSAPAEVGLEETQIVYSTNADGTWSSDAQAPGFAQTPGTYTYEGAGAAVFTGPSGKTRKLGVCVLKQYMPSSPTACNTVADCGSAPSSLPAGGARYCTAENNSGQKTCFFRPGSAANWCAGSPANGGVAVAPGYYQTPLFSAGLATQKYISYGCFEGCAATDPSSSSVGVYPPKQCQQYCNGVCCRT